MRGSRAAGLRPYFRIYAKEKTSTDFRIYSVNGISRLFVFGTARFVSDLVGIPENRFSHVAAQFLAIHFIRVLMAYMRKNDVDQTAPRLH